MTKRLDTIDQLTKPGRRPEAQRAQLEIAAVRDRNLDREIASDWSAVDGETWRRLDGPKRRKNSTASRPSTPE